MSGRHYSQKSKKNYIFAPGGLSIDWSALHENIPEENNICYLVALNRRQIAVLQTMTRSLLKWRWIWEIEKGDTETYNESQNFKEKIQECLMAGCEVSELIATNRMIAAALAGESVDLTAELPDSVDYSETGVSARIEQTRITTEEVIGNAVEQLEDIAGHLSAIATQLAGSPYEDELEGIVEQVGFVATVLGVG